MRTLILQTNSYADVFHQNELLRSIRFNADAKAASQALKEGLYVAVAVSDEDDLEILFERTQNGGTHTSWSRTSDPAITVLGGGTVQADDGRDMGYKSSSMGDVFVLDGVPHICGRTVFSRLEIEGFDPGEIEVINGGKVYDHLAAIDGTTPGI